MKIDRNYAQKVFRFLPEQLRAGAVIAGGWVASPALAGDIDVWVLAPSAPNESPWFRARGAMYQRLVDLGLAETIADDSVKNNYGTQHHLVATIPKGYAGRDVQLLLSDLPTPQALVDSFDISTHALAVQFPAEGGSKMYFASKWTPVNEAPKVMRFTTPEQTLDRLIKIGNRYGIRPADTDLNALGSRVAHWKAA